MKGKKTKQGHAMATDIREGEEKTKQGHSMDPDEREGEVS